MIQRLFYLATSVKVQFFKSFILPYFDYCSSLFMYYSKALLQKLSNIYYMCLFKLFKFNFITDAEEANTFLSQYGLFSFQHRLLVRFSTFSYRMYSLDCAPPSLQNQFKNTLNQTSHSETLFLPLSLRSRQVSRANCSNLKFGELTFGKFFPKFIERCNLVVYLENHEYNYFYKQLIINLKHIFVSFLKHFLKFDLYIKNFNFIVKSNIQTIKKLKILFNLFLFLFKNLFLFYFYVWILISYFLF